MDGWQDIAAAAVVAVTVAVFVWRLATRAKQGTGCGGACGCDMARRKVAPGGKR
ncbi:MAG: FeoB-associated Cys-rich membrane protein [Verrucomicrobiales bacterium]|nr:FeoB-associated Cys-rich membrane protein [Verrucomicrobiota bacterium JB025]